MDEDLYQVLGISRSASADEIKKAYRKLARQYHPDKNPKDKTAEKKFKQVQEAFDILGEPAKRKQYDQFGMASFSGAGGPPPGGGGFQWHSAGGRPDIHFDFGGQPGGAEDWGDLLSGLFGGSRPAGQGRSTPVNHDLETTLAIPLRTAALGGDVDLPLPLEPGRKVTVKIPAGVAEGARLRIAGKGRPASRGGSIGDLVAVVRVEPHPYFTRKDADILVDVPITVTEAVLGVELDVPTLDGSISLQVPAGSSSGQKLRIRGKGGRLPTGERADQYVVLKIVTPKNLDEASQNLLREFAQRNPQNPRRDLGW